jgi:AcrR family transcriptional regulator
MSDTVAPSRPPGRPRSAVADEAIRDAAVELFAERGFEGPA